MPRPSLPFGRSNGKDERSESLAEFLREETTGGKLLLAATAIALLWANLAPGAYEQIWGAELGPHWLHLHLPVAAWVSDGLLAVFFFVAGMEVKRELTVGELAGWRAAALPLLAAAGGMIVPALVALAVSGGRAADGGAWAVPVATDIAFALGVLALAGSALPAGVRVLLLSMAVIDDLGAIALIAVLFTQGLNLLWLLAGLALCGAYWLAQRHRRTPLPLMIPLVVAAWVCIHASGVHATVTGVLLGLLTPVVAGPGEKESPAERLEHRLHPISAGLIVPLFALAAAGIGLGAIGTAVSDPIAQGIFFGLLVGKVVGIFGGAYLAVRLRLASLPSGVGWADVLPVAVLGGIGYTVSLLIARLTTDDPVAAEHAATSVLAASFIASAVGLVLLRLRTRAHS
ncbi:Na+/H+ antiporter NhaA [Actinomadura craniellae]|uniref:Na(+)/H(+) antiporter NhaA n=2 Tax=Actinomadura craniellae TaxID=2231787 RepID=A0A365HDV6_9ACTN|nr:Na+/H+ antiporter NhaA [Actinomadura craniellae]